MSNYYQQTYSQQPNYQQMYPANNNRMVDPALMRYVKEDYNEAEVADFSMIPQQNLLSPLSTSPLDAPDFEADEIMMGSNSISGSPFGNPAGHPLHYYSASMPVNRTVGLLHPHGYPVMRIEDEKNNQDEKRRRRKESHNAVERRRRDLINDKINELAKLLPPYAIDAQNKPHKGTVLKRSVDYLKHVTSFADLQIERNRELERVLMQLCHQNGIDQSSLGLSFPLGRPVEMPVMNMMKEEDDGQ